jgi:hypothetical protein
VENINTDALARLPTAQQRAIVLREWYGLSYREVATELGLTVSATETLIFRARCRLAQELGGPAPTARRRTPLSVAWFLGGGPAVKAVLGVTSVAVLAVAGSARLGLLPHPGSHHVTPLVQRVHVPATVEVSQRFVPARRRASTHVAAQGPATVAVTPTASPGHQAVPEQEAPPQEVAPVVDVAPPAADSVGSVSDPTVADTPAPTADPPGQSGDTHGPNDNAAAGQAQRDDAANGNANPAPGVPQGRGKGDDAVAVPS